MNRLFSEGAVDDRTYAGFALSQTIPNWESLPDKSQEKMIANFKGKTFDYELTGSAEEINKKAATAITLINDETAKAIKDAKGNSFLINKITRTEPRPLVVNDKEINEAVEGMGTRP